MSRKFNKREERDVLHLQPSHNDQNRTTDDRIQKLEAESALIRKKLNLVDQTSQIQYRLLQQKINQLTGASTGDKHDELRGLFENLSQEVAELKQSIDSIVSRSENTALESEDLFANRILPIKEDFTNELDDNTEKTDAGLESKDNDEEFKQYYKVEYFPEDTFSYLAVADYFENYIPTAAFSLALFALLIQVTTLTIFTMDVVSFDEANPFSVPPGVGIQVRVSQLIALLISCWNQDEIRSSLNILQLGYNKDRVSTINRGATRFKWYGSILTRIIVGAYTLFVTFILIINSDTVRDAMLDFAAVTFVSGLDNGAFILSYWGYMGHKMQELTMSMKTIPLVDENSSKSTKRKRKIPRLASLTFILIIICSLWAWIASKQARGHYMHQTIFVQFGDDYSPAIGAFSGLYQLVLDRSNDGMHANFVEVGMESATFSYCSKDSVWLFQYDSQPGEGHYSASDFFSPCWSRARSSETDELDITNTGAIPWYVFDDTLLLEMPLQHFAVYGRTSYYGQFCENHEDCGERMYCEQMESKVENEDDEDSKICVCKNGLFGLNCEFPDPCQILDIDPRNEGFLGTRSWSRRFESLQEDGRESPIQVYGKPVYIGQSQIDGMLDVLLFTGRRWILTDSNSIDDYKFLHGRSARNLAEFLAENFHAYWSNYTFYFASEPVDVGTPIDSATPVGLNWFRIETSGTQGASLRSGEKIWHKATVIEANLFCAVCNDGTNPCFYGASCSPDDGTCECTTGSSGRLCQIPPDGNGQCDMFFNTPEFNFDGGDCCLETCMSTEEYTCGKGMIHSSSGVSAYGFIGYPNCQDPRFSSKLSGSTTLFEIVERGFVRCGSDPFPLFFDYSDGVYSGLEVDLCKSIAAAALGDPEAVEWVWTNTSGSRFTGLAEGNFDVTLHRVTYTAERDIFQPDAKMGLSFVPTPYFFDGLRYAGIPPFSECADKVDFESTECLDLKICVTSETSWSVVTRSLFPDSVIVELESGAMDGLNAGLCNVIAGEIRFVAEPSARARGFTGPAYHVGENVYSKEPLTAVTRQDDRVWFKFVSWVFEALTQAEESGITRLTANSLLPPTDVFGEPFRNMFRNAVAANGNYGEIYEKNLGGKIPRSGMNTINRGDSGLIYSFPFGAIETHGLDPVVGGTIQSVRRRRVLNCGICRRPGFATLDTETGTWRGFQIDMCRGIAAALFNGYTNVNFTPLTPTDRFRSLADGTVDIMACGTTHTLRREVNEISTGIGFDFTPTIFYDGMGFGGTSPYVLCAEILDFVSLDLSPECPNTRICVLDGSSWLESLRGNLNIPEVNIVVTASMEETYDKFNSGVCNVIAGESSQIAESVVREMGYSANNEYLISQRKFTKEPLAIVSRSDDAQFSDFLRWIVLGFFHAAENEITRDDYFGMPASTLLFGNALSGMWRRAIEAVGNYDEMFERNFEGVLERGGLNEVNKGGPQFYAKPGVI